MPTNKPRYTITLGEEMLKRIDDFRFENHIPSKTKATLELIQVGLTAVEKQRDTEIPQDTPACGVTVPLRWCRLQFFKDQLAAAQRALDWTIKRNYPQDRLAYLGEAISFYEWAVQMAEREAETMKT